MTEATTLTPQEVEEQLQRQRCRLGLLFGEKCRGDFDESFEWPLRKALLQAEGWPARPAVDRTQEGGS
jgi:hypothetical protein